MESLKTTNIILIRHGESFNNCLYDVIRDKLGHDIPDSVLEAEEAKLREPDCGLSTRGHQQAASLGEYFAKKLSNYMDKDNCVMFSSPMKRCLWTTKYVAESLGKSVTVIPNLFESSGCFVHNHDGSTKGLRGDTATKIEEDFPNFKCVPGMEDGWYFQDEMETYAEFRERAKEITEWIWSLHNKEDSRDAIIVCHGNVMSAVISGLLRGNGLIVHNNTAFSHLQLMTVPNVTTSAALKSMNNVLHLAHDDSLLTGNDVVKDHWIQEYIEYM